MSLGPCSVIPSNHQQRLPSGRVHTNIHVPKCSTHRNNSDVRDPTSDHIPSDTTRFKYPGLRIYDFKTERLKSCSGRISSAVMVSAKINAIKDQNYEYQYLTSVPYHLRASNFRNTILLACSRDNILAYRSIAPVMSSDDAHVCC